MHQSLQNTSNRKQEDVLQAGASDMMQMPLFSGEKLHSVYFQIPGKEGLTLPTGEKVMLLKDTWVLLGRAWMADSQEPQISTLRPLEMVSFRFFWKGLLFLEFCAVVFFPLHFALDSQ